MKKVEKVDALAGNADMKANAAMTIAARTELRLDATQLRLDAMDRENGMVRITKTLS